MITDQNTPAQKLEKIRSDFPALSVKVNGKPLVYFDSGATAQKPRPVIEAITDFYASKNANIHRGVHTLSQEATTLYENARAVIMQHLNAAQPEEIIFTAGTTAAINMVASCIGKMNFEPGDEVLVSEMEHHINILPWQLLCEEKKGKLRVIPVTANGELDLSELDNLLGPKTRIVSVVHVSNTLGTLNPVEKIISAAHKKNIPVLIDGAQAIPHMKVDVKKLGADFYCFSGHKVYGPTGIGVLYIDGKMIEKIPNYQVGGGTIKTVSFEKTDYAESPLRFEAGTPNISGAIGLAEAISYINDIGWDTLEEMESGLMTYALHRLDRIEGLEIFGSPKNRAGVISFNLKNAHPYDVGMILDKQGIAVRTGHHCTQPLLSKFGLSGTVRVSLSFYNTPGEIDLLISGLEKAKKMLE